MKIAMCVPDSTLVQNVQQFPAEDPTLQKLRTSPGTEVQAAFVLVQPKWAWLGIMYSLNRDVWCT